FLTKVLNLFLKKKLQDDAKMPLNRKIMAADQELAEKLSKLAEKYNTSLFNLTNKAISSYIIMEKSGYGDPVDGAVDLTIFQTLLSFGFKLEIPNLEGDEAKKAGRAVWILISSRVDGADKDKVLLRLLSLFVGEKNVFTETKNGEKRFVVSLPINPKVNEEALKDIIYGFLEEAYGRNRFEIENKAKLLIISIFSD
ncbi:MAG: hypothetical protein ACPLSP_01195, partial [Fervidicoccus fontis]